MVDEADEYEGLDEQRGELAERVFVFPPFAEIPIGATSPLNTVPIVSDNDTCMRLLAIRGGLKNSHFVPVPPLALEALELEISINGTEELTELSQPCEFAGLFTPQAPWLYFACPPRIEHREALHARVRNRHATMALTPYLQALVIDESTWLAQLEADLGEEEDAP